jgi:hypothetical protein
MFPAMDDPGDDDVALEIDELGSLVIDLRTAFDRPAAAEVAARHLELMEAALAGSEGPDGDTTPPFPT